MNKELSAQQNEMLNSFINGPFKGGDFISSIEKLEGQDHGSESDSDINSDYTDSAYLVEGVDETVADNLKRKRKLAKRAVQGQKLGLPDLSLVNLASLFAYSQSVGDLHTVVQVRACVCACASTSNLFL